MIARIPIGALCQFVNGETHPEFNGDLCTVTEWNEPDTCDDEHGNNVSFFTYSVEFDHGARAPVGDSWIAAHHQLRPLPPPPVFAPARTAAEA